MLRFGWLSAQLQPLHEQIAPVCHAADPLAHSIPAVSFRRLCQLAIGENSALAIPVPILIAILALFLAGVAYVIFLIFDSDKQRSQTACTSSGGG